jgi:hypothetical protein
MAATATLLPGGQYAKRWTVTFSADADATLSITHGFNGAPFPVIIVPLNAQAYIGQVSRGTVDATAIQINKNVAGGSGGASVEVIAFMPYSITG